MSYEFYSKSIANLNNFNANTLRKYNNNLRKYIANTGHNLHNLVQLHIHNSSAMHNT